MNAVAFEVVVILLLLVANGVFAMAEIAVVSARKARLRRLADQGNGKLVMYTDGTTLQLGDVDAGKDADGYPNSFYESRYTLKRRN